MIEITRLSVDYSLNKIVTDNTNPVISFNLESTDNNVEIIECYVQVDDWKCAIKDKFNVKYDGPQLKPFSKHQAKVFVKTSKGDTDVKSTEFECGFLNTHWKANWISDPIYKFNEKHISPKVICFRKKITLNKDKKIKAIKLYSTALGIYNVYIDGKKINENYFAPGFTSYKHNLMYQTYDLTNYQNDFELTIAVAGGWAIGSFVMNRQNRFANKKQALLAEVHISYDDEDEEIIGTDNSWLVTTNTPFRKADFYDGEIFDANIELFNNGYHNASIEQIKINPKIIADYGVNVVEHEHFKPQKITKYLNKYIIDFGQNFAGFVHFKVKDCAKNNKIIIRHAEVLDRTGDLNTRLLRSAKATITYISNGREFQEYKPSFTYMGFRYISVEGVDLDNLEIEAIALYSNLETIGDFKCSNEKLNRLQKNIVWSSKSNFVDIPTDCPQRDERMGWTGDINIFCETAFFNFDMTRFLVKWLIDVKAEQGKGGGIPNTVPSNGYGFPLTMPKMAIDFWGDACVTLPLQIYKETGRREILLFMYECMKKYVNAEIFWANLFGIGKNRYIFKTIDSLHFGDWLAPDVNNMNAWQHRHKYTATVSLKYCLDKISETAKLLDLQQDKNKFNFLSEKVKNAFKTKLMDKNEKIKNEFQTGYVLPIYFNFFNDNELKLAVNNLDYLVKKAEFKIQTGFPGTPYILFALCDNGRKDSAFKMLLNEKCPSWLYEVNHGATTIWERWDGLTEEGYANCPDDGTGGMISFNHYASGAVGNFFYKRILGIERVKEGYKEFKIKPIIGGNIKSAEGYTLSAYGKISVSWKIIDKNFYITIHVPIGTKCNLIMPSGNSIWFNDGTYFLNERII